MYIIKVNLRRKSQEKMENIQQKRGGCKKYVTKNNVWGIARCANVWKIMQ